MQRNPFLYITARSQDFETDLGKRLHSQFSQIFLAAYKKYSSVISKVVPDDVYVRRKAAEDEVLANLAKTEEIIDKASENQ